VQLKVSKPKISSLAQQFTKIIMQELRNDLLKKSSFIIFFFFPSFTLEHDRPFRKNSLSC